MALAIFSISIFAQQGQFSKVKVYVNESQLTELAKTGVDVTEGYLKKGTFLVSDFSQKELVKIQELGLNYEILVEDVSKFYADRNIGKSTNVNDYKGTSEWAVPENFEFGSMGGHATYDEIVAHLDNMATLYPDLITVKESIGQTIQEKEMWMVKISDNPAMNETEPEVLYTALHHAREPAGVMNLLYYMYYLLENYDSDPLIQILVDNTEMYFVPVVNPDGYVHNQTTNPNGGGMWRKNRRDNGDGEWGVDINRNYGFMWGLDNEGSSPYTWDETYRGTEAFSEPETQNIKVFCENHEFVNALNYHTYSNLLLYAWGYTEELCPDDDIYFTHATLMTQDNNYTYGAGSTTIYPTNGGSDDWMYGEQEAKNKTLAYTPELGGSDDGFWCSIDRIIPIAQENMIQNILAAAFAGVYASVEETGPTVTNINEGYLTYDITRLGLKAGGAFSVSIEPISAVIISTGDPKEYASMAILETISDSISYALPPFVANGTQFQFLLSVDNGDYILTDTISKMYGEAVSLIEDNCNDITTWVTPNWDVTTTTFNSPTGSITDSPFGDYPNNHTSTVILDTEVDLSNVGFAFLNFWAKWEIEQGWDYVQIEISTNGGSGWTPLSGKYTVTGNGYQAEGEPVYDGFQTNWIEEEIDLSDFIGNMVTFRFKLKTDVGVTEDGFYFDDFSVKVVEFATTGLNTDMTDLSLVHLSNPIPNPANGKVQFNYTALETTKDLNFVIYNAVGQEVYNKQLNAIFTNFNIDVNGWNPGIYYYKINGADIDSKTKKLLIIR